MHGVQPDRDPEAALGHGVAGRPPGRLLLARAGVLGASQGPYVCQEMLEVPGDLIIIIIIMIIALQGAIRDFFYNLLTAPRTVSNTYVQVARGQSCANHVQHIERLSRASVMLRATWYEGTAQLLKLTELKSHLFELYFIG